MAFTATMASPSSSSPSAATRTMSTSTTDKVSGIHHFEIRDYSLVSLLGGPVTSGVFTVAGHDWSLVYHPKGCPIVRRGHASAYVQAVQLMTAGAEAKISFTVQLINRATGLKCTANMSTPTALSTAGAAVSDKVGITLRKVTEIEDEFVDKDRDSLTVECAVTVFAEPRTSVTTRLPAPAAPAPALDGLPAQLGELLESRRWTDVAFDVDGEEFAAHRAVLAARSPVFEAELFGPMSGAAGAGHGAVRVRDMPPAAFKALLTFIYTDKLSGAAMEDGGLDEDKSRELARHLLVAADRYAVDGLKVLCQSVLSASLTPQTVASTLALADRHGCHELKDACVEFIISLGVKNDALAPLVRRDDDDDDGRFSCLSFFKHLLEHIARILKIQ